MDPGLAVGARPIAEVRGLAASETPLAPIVNSAANATALRNMRLTPQSIAFTAA